VFLCSLLIHQHLISCSGPAISCAMSLLASLLIAVVAASTVLAHEDHTSLADELRSAGLTGFTHLLEEADLFTYLKEQSEAHGGITILAPSDSALMSAVSPSLMAFLKHPSNRDTLRNVLLHHVIPERVSAFHWDGTRTTLEGSALNMKMDALAFRVAGVAVEQYNALVSDSGLTVHAISGFLVPSSLTDEISQVVESEEPRMLTDMGMGMAPAPSPMSMPMPMPMAKLRITRKDSTPASSTPSTSTQPKSAARTAGVAFSGIVACLLAAVAFF
jgi:uncharacterized surface protein with fasciclin (FAS1) repeats